MRYVNVTNADAMPQEESRPFSVGALADPEGVSKPRISLLRRSSKPVMRASFQAEAAKLAQIPDDVDDDGGVESALLKLEGKYEQRKSEISSQSFTQDFAASSEGDFDRASVDVDDETDKRRRRYNQVVEQKITDSEVDEPGPSGPPLEEFELQPTVYQPPSGEDSFDFEGELVNTIPLLQRDHSQYGTEHRQSRSWAGTSVLRGPSQERDEDGHRGSQFSQTSIDFVDRTESLNNIPAGGTLPRHMSADESFLEIDDDSKSDLSSEMSLEVISTTEFPGNIARNAFPPIQPGTIITEINISSPSKSSEEAPMTIQEALGMAPTAKISAFPPTPDDTPTFTQNRNELAMRSWYGDDQLEMHQRQNIDESISPGPLYVEDHMPFILSFPSSLLAQQFTLIEKETLNEIHFRELLEMKWSHEAASSSRSWPKFLQSLQKMEEDDTVSHGIEICGARSSIMTQWAISQVVLTRQLDERARTVAKLIRIASHCRRLGNYATVFQLTVALTSAAVAELGQTWARVGAAEAAQLAGLEALIQPANNFRRLRDEMEGVLGARACIPLVAIYAKDLTALRDMPSYIASTPRDAPLINVSKCRAQAAVVQLLSRYLERSAEYRFAGVAGVVARCLWVGGLSAGQQRRAAGG